MMLLLFMDEDSVLDNFLVATPANEPVSQNRGIALSVLHWIELQSLRFEFRRIRDKHAFRKDEWWVTQSEEISGPVTFKGALDILLTGGVPIAVVHDSVAEEDPTPWEPLSYSSWVAQPGIVRIWKPAFWIAAVSLGWVALYFVVPSILRIPAQIAYLGGLAYLAWRINRSPQMDS